ncbi:hypothetical protein [Nonomuraea solani]|uniref:hypothetical protein n=1 Tax=Nonomuraea solani TaxID=1144553 RepID=UPI0011AFF22B|nr:hypothetical protein [Nonomuraea solani]
MITLPLFVALADDAQRPLAGVVALAPGAGQFGGDVAPGRDTRAFDALDILDALQRAKSSSRRARRIGIGAGLVVMVAEHAQDGRRRGGAVLSACLW